MFALSRDFSVATYSDESVICWVVIGSTFTAIAGGAPCCACCLPPPHAVSAIDPIVTTSSDGIHSFETRILFIQIIAASYVFSISKRPSQLNQFIPVRSVEVPE